MRSDLTALKERIEPDVQAEIDRMNATLAVKSSSVFTVMAGARRICKREYQRSPNWVLAMELFGLGSTYAHAICRQNGIDPDANKVSRSALTAKEDENV